MQTDAKRKDGGRAQGRAMRWALMLSLVMLALPNAGCLSHLPPDANPVHANEIHWATDFDDAKRIATQTDRPILMCLVAGDITGFC